MSWQVILSGNSPLNLGPIACSLTVGPLPFVFLGRSCPTLGQKKVCTFTDIVSIKVPFRMPENSNPLYF